MVREIRDKDGKLIGTVRSTHPIANFFVIVFALSLMVYAVGGGGAGVAVVAIVLALMVVGAIVKRTSKAKWRA